MSNTLTDLIPDIHEGMDVVAREGQGLIQAVHRNAKAEQAAKDETIRYPIVGVAPTYDVTPAATVPTTGDQVITNGTMTINKVKSAHVNFEGEEEAGLVTAGTFSSIEAASFAQGFRSLSNLVEADIAALHAKMSRAYGTAGTTPFATVDNFTDFSKTRQILKQNGAPASGLKLVLGGAAMANLLGRQASLFKVNEAGESGGRTMGSVGRLMGFDIFESEEIVDFTNGTGTSYLLNDASSAVGDTTIAADTGSGTVIAGDVVVFAGDTTKYVVASALSGGSFTIGAPGLRVALADNATITIQADHECSMAFSEQAIHLVTRLPKLPSKGDGAIDRIQVTDPHSGLVFDVATYGGYHKNHTEISLAWGTDVVKAEFGAKLLG